MNYLPLGGYWFYGGASDVERATYFCSYGLLRDAPDPVVPSFVSRVVDWFWEFFRG